jgi:hypothetical protein
MFASLYVCLATSSSPLIPDFVDGQLESIVLQSSTYFDCIRPLVSQFEWLLRVCDVLVDVLVDKIPDRIDAAGDTILIILSVKTFQGL